MKRIMSSVAVLVAAVLSVGVAAQSNGTMGTGDKMDKTEMKDSTYTGCLEAGGEPGSFTLTHLAVCSPVRSRYVGFVCQTAGGWGRASCCNFRPRSN
jgi:hypothetical protein